MHFNVSELMREPSGSTRRYQVDEWVALTDADEVQVTGPISFVKADKGIWVTTQFRSHVHAECGRCLDEHLQAVDIVIDEEALPKLDPTTGSRLLNDKGADEVLVIDEDNVLDLTEPIRQYVAIGVPMQPLCREECKGLCATCGVNWNYESCTCDNIQRDTRWGVLLDMVPSTETMEMSKN